MRDIVPGIDFKAAGGYIVAVPSIHPDGGEYRFEKGKSFSEKPPAKLPPQWIDYLQRLWAEREDAAYEAKESVASNLTAFPTEHRIINVSIGSVNTFSIGG